MHDFNKKNFGTEKVEELVNELFPEARVARMDFDSVKGKYEHDTLIKLFEQHQIDILIGTQMVVKGLHFDEVSLVGIIDADGLNLLAQQPTFMQELVNRGDTCITPHPGEAARLLHCKSSAIQIDRMSALRSLVALTKSVVVLKGQHTLLASPQHPVQQCLQGNAGLAVAGMGDVLTGCIAAMAGQGVRHGLSLWQAAALGVQMHAIAGDQLLAKGIGPIGMTPSELALEIRNVLNLSLK
jgi:hydroxyethylthiazole kinase-like uncharacterized protein yjeF